MSKKDKKEGKISEQEKEIIEKNNEITAAVKKQVAIAETQDNPLLRDSIRTISADDIDQTMKNESNIYLLDQDETEKPGDKKDKDKKDKKDKDKKDKKKEKKDKKEKKAKKEAAAAEAPALEPAAPAEEPAVEPAAPAAVESPVTVVSTEKAPAAIGPYSQAIIAGDYVFASGQIPINAKTGEIEGEDIQTQATRVCKNVRKILKAAGTDLEHVVKTTCFLADLADFEAFNEVYAQYFTSNPARSCVAVKEIPKGVLCEIEVVAYLG